MSENILVHDPERTRLKDCAYCTAPDLPIGAHDPKSLHTPFVMHGLAPWMQERGLDYGPDGYLVVLLCTTHRAEREILKEFKGAGIRADRIRAVMDHATPPPRTPPANLEEAIERAETVEELKVAMLELVKRGSR